MSTSAGTHVCWLPPRAAAGGGAALIAQPVNAMLLSGVPPRERRFVGKTFLKPPAHIASTCSAKALEWPDTWSDEIAMPPTSNPTEKALFQLTRRRGGI